MAETPDLRSLRDQPFELLRALERRSERAASGQAIASAAGDRVGVAVRIAGLSLLIPREEVREVTDFPAVTRVPGARGWVRGIGNMRGQLMPVVDVSAFALGVETRPARSTRLIVVNHAEIPAALIVDEVMGFRRFSDEEFAPQAAELAEGLQDYLVGRYQRGQETWPVLSLVRLIESARFNDVAA